MLYRSGTITITGDLGNAIFAGGDASVSVITDPGTVIKVSSNAALEPGIDVETDGAAASGTTVTVNAASQIDMSAVATPDPNKYHNPVAIHALSFADAPISVNYAAPALSPRAARESASLRWQVPAPSR